MEYNIPTIGVAKNLVVIPDMEILRDEKHAEKVNSFCFPTVRKHHMYKFLIEIACVIVLS